MANKRMINGSIWEDEFFTVLSIFHRLLWVGIITQCADDQGRLRDNAALIRSNVFPLDDISLKDIEDGITEFYKAGKIERYKADEKELIQIKNWWKHQSPRWAGSSIYPAPDGWVDRERYHGKENIIVTKNWDSKGGYIEDYIEDNTINDIKDDIKGDIDIKDEDDIKDEVSPVGLLFGAFVTAFQREPYSNERDNWIKQLSEMAGKGVNPADIKQAFIELAGEYTITSPKSIKNAAITCMNKRKLGKVDKPYNRHSLDNLTFDNVEPQ